MYGLAKLAASFDAQRNKQYWQLLKRLHGGTEEAVQGIKQSGDDGIWHGTRAEKIPQIDQEGLKVGPFREFGKGTFFGSKRIADLYGAPKVMSPSGFNAGNVSEWDAKNFRQVDLSDPAEMVEYVRNNPESSYKLSEGALVRMAKPSELKGTKQLYPNPQNVKVFDMKDGKLEDVAASQTTRMPEKDDGIQRIVQGFTNKVKKSSDEERAPLIEDLVRKDRASQPDWVWKDYTPEMHETDVREEVQHMLDKLRSSEARDANHPEAEIRGNRWFGRTLRPYTSTLQEELAKKLMVPRNDRELHQLQTYGKLRGRRLFDRLNASNQRKEMFVDHQDVGPELLRHEDGAPLKGERTNVR